jgi:hypothetical protein
VDLSGWTIASSHVLRVVPLPAGDSIAAGGFLVVDGADLPPGLNAGDEVHLFSQYGVQVDAYAWRAKAGVAFARCPDGIGPFVTAQVPTRALPNACPHVVS